MKEKEDLEQDKKYEKLGSAVMGIAWILYAVKIVAVVSFVALVVLWIIHKPLWIAPLIGIGAYVMYRIIWRLFWKFIRWSQKK